MILIWLNPPPTLPHPPILCIKYCMYVVLHFGISGMIRIHTQDVLTTGTNANRTAASIGDSISLSFTAGHVGDGSQSYNTPLTEWIKDGATSTIMPTNAAVSANGRLSSALSFSFQESDAGVYQCFFIGSNFEIYGTIPLRIDTGKI